MDLKKTLISIYKEAKEQFGLQKAPKLYLRDDVENSKNIFGKTAYYNPSNTSIVLYITNRHPKDICRSFCHELIHHYQNDILPFINIKNFRGGKAARRLKIVYECWY